MIKIVIISTGRHFNVDDRSLKDCRLKAERAVADMPAGDLKVKAFEVILGQLLASSRTATLDTESHREKQNRPRSAIGQPNTLSGRILALQGDGFFETPQPIAAVREGLQSRGWRYPVTTLSGTLQGLVQRRKLRRERMREGKKAGWKYFNP